MRFDSLSYSYNLQLRILLNVLSQRETTQSIVWINRRSRTGDALVKKHVNSASPTDFAYNNLISSNFFTTRKSMIAAISVFLMTWTIPVRALAHSSLPSNSQRHVRSSSTATKLYNIYDDWRSDAVVDTMFLDEDNVRMVLEELIDSDYGAQMFGCHERAASIGVTGSIEFVEMCGPEVTLSLSGQFWHRRETVLGRAAMWLNARMPEITDVVVAEQEELKDFEDVLDDFGEVLYQKDKRSPDYNGDREAMEYQGRDPDMRGPFPQGPMGSGTMINPV